MIGEIYLKKVKENIRSHSSELEGAYKQVIDHRFNTETGSDGKRWSPLSPYTLKRKRTNRILFETGRMKESIDPKAVFKNDELWIEYRGFEHYLVYHQSTAPRHKLPRRPVVEGWTENDKTLVMPVIRRMFNVR